LLPPALGFSDRLGASYAQPFFWAIDDRQDATFYLHHLSRRGEMLGLEYRYVLDEASRGVLMYDFFEDRKVDDGTSASEDWAFDETPIRSNRDRYWLRGRIDQSLPGRFMAKLDLDFVSDPDYLLEFNSGLTGFGAGNLAFTDAFGRELDASEERVRTNRLNLHRAWSQYSLNLDTLWLDDVVGRRENGVNNELQRLQSITFDGIRQPLAGTGLHFDLASEYRYFYLDNRRRGQRVDIHPRAYWPLRLGRHLALEPSMGVRQTAWYVTHDRIGSQAQDEWITRELADLRLDASSALYRVYRPGMAGIEALNHIIQPQIVYEYVPGQIRDKYPLFDEDIDRIDRTNRITALLTQTFITRRRPEALPEKATDGREPSAPPGPIYREIGYIELSQGYDVREARDGHPSEPLDADSHRPFSPLALKLEFSPVDALSVSADVERSPYSGHFDARNIAIGLSDRRGDELYVRHRYSYAVSESVLTRLLVPLTDTLTTYGEWERNLDDRRTLEVGAGLLYTSQCWALDLGYLHGDASGGQLSVMVHLYGLGGLGQQSVLARRIKDPFARRAASDDSYSSAADLTGASQ
jgi:LPS-assembly protein